jgi:hypothetical protein
MTKKEFAFLMFGYLLAHGFYSAVAPYSPVIPASIRMQLIDVSPIPTKNVQLSMEPETI